MPPWRYLCGLEVEGSLSFVLVGLVLLLEEGGEEQDQPHGVDLNCGEHEAGRVALALGAKELDSHSAGDAGDELQDLSHGQELSPRNLDAQSAEEEVRVHDGVDGAVEAHHPGNPRSLGHCCTPHGDRNASVVVHLEQGRLPALDDEHPGVDELVVLGEVKDCGPKAEFSIVPHRVVRIAVSCLPAVLLPVAQDQRPRVHHDCAREDNEHKIVQRHQQLEDCAFAGGAKLLAGHLQQWLTAEVGHDQ
mmetsp:Transcript_28582/g.83656  ORF Transcript_28582/g.83656 Transcript_28582/m.83656 type:complete len:247 (-) Transcript_28582:182-922(-)